MVEPGYALKALLAMSAATFLTRVFPFLLPRRYKDSEHLRYIGAMLPPAVMLLLVLYCLKGTQFTTPPYGFAELLSVAVVVALHLWKRHALVSIGLGTACYVLLVQTRLLG